MRVKAALKRKDDAFLLLAGTTIKIRIPERTI
jgi:hypothetical protein